jgi:hypothetical protein
MLTTFDGSGRVIQQPSPEPSAEAAPPPTAGGLARTCCRVAGHTGDWTYPDERCIRVRMCQRCGQVTSKRLRDPAPGEHLVRDVYLGEGHALSAAAPVADDSTCGLRAGPGQCRNHPRPSGVPVDQRRRT